MTKITKKTSAGGCQFIALCIVTLPVFVIGFAALGTGPLGLILWPIFCYGIKKAVQEIAEKEFPGEMRDAIASEGFKRGQTRVEITNRGWSDAPISLPNKLTTKYTLEEDD